jgi:hypothetical protein
VINESVADPLEVEETAVSDEVMWAVHGVATGATQ